MQGRRAARYSHSVSDDFNYGAPAAPPPAGAAAPRRSPSRAATWSIVALVVLILASAGGLLTAWVVASMNAVPGPVAGASPTPHATVQGSVPAASAGASSQPSGAPRRTPTPAPTVQVTPAPFTYVVQPGDHLINIANQFSVDIQDVMDLNNITNPNKIFVGEQLLIPGYGVQPTPKPAKSPKH